MDNFPRVLRLAFNHIVFPPKLPGEQDADDVAEDVERELTRRLLDAIRALKNSVRDEAPLDWEYIESALNTCNLVNGAGYIDKTSLLQAFQEVKLGNPVIIRVALQNASLIVRQCRENTQHVIFEAFETSPVAGTVLSSKGALQCDFPGVAVSMPLCEFEKPAFQDSLATFLDKASVETVQEFEAKARKAGVDISETRDTVDPALITQFLMTLLEANGTRVHPPILRKRVKDDVCWDRAEIPWRRSPCWLTLRVSVQRFLYLSHGCDIGRPNYKFLMCYLLSQLLVDSVDILSPEECNFLKTKLCRRLAKLETEKDSIQDPHLIYTYQHLFEIVGPMCQESISFATDKFEREWSCFKDEIRRQVPLLPFRASEKDLHLELPKSSVFLRNVIDSWRRPQKSSKDAKSVDPDSSAKDMEQFTDLTEKHDSIAKLELDIEIETRSVPKTKSECGMMCADIATRIEDYTASAGKVYRDDPEQLSTFILSIFELWVHMDKCAQMVFPLLKEYHPVFHPELLDVLLLSRLSSLNRLREIQLYLKNRSSGAQRKTIFADPESGCFADKFVGLEEAANLRELLREIEAASLAARSRKEAELTQVNQDCEDAVEGQESNSCTRRQHPDGSHDIRGCSYCYHGRCRRRLKIEVHEDFLPSQDNTPRKNAVVFELGIPKPFAAYRQATWTIISILSQDVSSSVKPEMLLRSYKQLKRFGNRNGCGNFSLASPTKSFLGTHYNWKRLPANKKNILLPLGLSFVYYDPERKVWAKDLPKKISFAHHFALKLPKQFPFSKLYASPPFAADGPGKSSYEIIAGAGEHPKGITTHEFTAHQSLTTGKNQRWVSILTELGSSNINFSLYDTVVLLQRLTLQVGPRSADDNLGVVLAVFRDVQFCNRLVEQVDHHLDTISTNWRENNYMEILLTISIQLYALCHPDTSTQANRLILRIRALTLQWIAILRRDMRSAQEVNIAERTASSCFLSALLCRRTFFAQAYDGSALDGKELKDFVTATLAMQESLVVDVSILTRATTNMLVRDIKMASRISPSLCDSAVVYSGSIGEAIDTVWPDAGGIPRVYGAWELLPRGWITSVTQGTDMAVSQTFRYHLLQGHLLVDGKFIGKLPPQMRNSEVLTELFGNQRPVALPSNLPDMTHVLGFEKDGQRIHLGYRDQKLVIKLQTPERILEHVPRSLFGSGPGADLPASLINSCVHWVDLRSECLEIRSHPRIWKKGNWVINLKSGKALGRQGSLELVNPHCSLFKSIAKIFRNFEQPEMLVVTQSRSSPGGLSVELKTMNLKFQVNRKQLLQCQQLGAEVDPNQDAGTLYGLESMLVLRNAVNRAQRSVITTMGKAHVRRHQTHVAVRMENDGNYARYVIDNVIGRLQCPPDPRLLYNKARMHAFTSYFIPDPLTGRTGTEEALRWLQSGCCKPWSPLCLESLDMLKSLSALTPSREYYPKDKQRQQIVHWNPNLTTTMQHDAYQPVVALIIRKTQNLSLFYPGSTNSTTDIPLATSHLCERARWRRSIYERPDIFSQAPEPPQDMVFAARDRWPTSTVGLKRTSNVHEIVGLLTRRPSSINASIPLVATFEKWAVIGGYTREPRSYFLDDTLGLDLGSNWGSLVKLCRDCKEEDISSLMFHLALISFGKGVKMDVLRTIIAFFLYESLREIELPEYTVFTEFKRNEEPDLGNLENSIKPFWQTYESAYPEREEKKGQKSLQKAQVRAARDDHERRCIVETRRLATFLIQQWPCSKPSVHGFESQHVELDQSLKAITLEWERLYKNHQLLKHAREVQDILDRHSDPGYKIEKPSSHANAPTKLWLPHRIEYISPRLGEDLMKKQGPITLPDLNHKAETVGGLVKEKLSALQSVFAKSKLFSSPEIVEVEVIANQFAQSDCSVRSSYGHDLKGSIAALRDLKIPAGKNKNIRALDFGTEMAKYNDDIDQARAVVCRYYMRIIEAIACDDSRFPWLRQCNLWPCMTAESILQQLRSTSHHVFGPHMKEAIISYALSIEKLQRLIRIKEAFAKREQAKFDQEYNNLGHINWDPSAYPDWLLLQIDSNMLIRPEQANVAFEMIYPTSGRNSVLQMNMGQGKTSVIMPMIASVLADGEALTRLLVPKALLSQTAQILQSRLGGLLGREITHIPFSRQTPTTPEIIRVYRKFHEDTLDESGIILGIPEHILSFGLSGIQRVSDSRIIEATSMVELRDWMNRNCRDVLDECDFTLAVKTQLIYPSGSQLTFDGHPDRWIVSMAVLELAASHLRALALEFPGSLDVVERGPGQYPIVYFSRKEIGEALTQRITDDICSGRTPILPIQQCAGYDREKLRKFMSEQTLSEQDVEYVSDVFRDMPKLRKSVYLLRGLLAQGIFLLCLKKRWNVRYGLDPRRDPLAVPFHAKGVPSDQSEWGHPDVAIMLTCLAFYYQGLSKKQLQDSLQAVLRADDPAMMYDRWTQTAPALPKSLRSWNIIDVNDDGQVSELWKHLRFATNVIDYFLCQFVFPVHARQFSIKLQASGWDVPLRNGLPQPQSAGEAKKGLTTGFSGTNDNRRLLPLTIKQQDLPGLAHTNAEVLSYLLQKRNRRYQIAADSKRKRLSELGLLSLLKADGIRILIDAGAFVLEMDNKTLARVWLQQDSDAVAAVYFGSDNKAMVLYQTGISVPLLATPFADNLDKCLVYLDEAHTRGTDLKLPPHERGALTLGLNQNKDHTVQAAMRLRQLGTTQSITFIAPPEVHQSILDICNKCANDKLDSSDVVTWLLDQTCCSNRELQSLYLAQGIDFCQRTQAAASYKDFLTNLDHRKSYLDVLRQPEQRTLEELYAPQLRQGSNAIPLSTTLDGERSEFMKELRLMQLNSNSMDGPTNTSAFEEVEQEREVAYEIEEEREIRRPPLMKANQFLELHESILKFVQTGTLANGGCYLKAAAFLESTQLGVKHGARISSFLPDLYVSVEFTNTVILKKGERNDNFTRPVKWILYSMNTHTALVIIPEEAEKLIPILRSVATPRVHLLLYAAPVTKRMHQFNRLGYYAIPSLPNDWVPSFKLQFEVGVLSGRLYFEFSEYEQLVNHLGLNQEMQQENSKLFMGFLQEWLALRRQGQDISHTPMGYICQGWKLRGDHPFFSSENPTEERGEAEETQSPYVAYAAEGGEHEEYSDDEEVGMGFGEIDEGEDWE
ncbi:hypothetical protein FQN54_004788 [Arachnomyces sp. PD_36]|nr:hypothetical protein FQN54_004788 [Arachnomyces sp. PD_36]